MTTQDNAWTTRKASRGASRACNPETEFRAGHSSRDAEVAELRSDLEVAEGILGAHAHAVPQIIAERDAYLEQRDASRAVNADLLAAQHRLIATLARVQTVVDDERIPDQVFGDDWVLAELLTKALAPPDSLAAEHRADLARQNEHYTAQPQNDDTGRDE